MKIRGFTAAVLAGLLIVAGAAPAHAAAGPTVSSTGLTEGQRVSNRTFFTPVVSADTVRVQLLINGTLNKTVTWPTARVGLTLRPELHDTEVSVTVKAFDAAEATAEATTQVHIDVVAPELSVSPPGNTIVHGPTKITVTPTTDDVTVVEMREGSSTVLARLTEAPWEITYDFTGRNANIYFTAYDSAGNFRNTSNIVYRVDDAGPSIELEYGEYRRPGVSWIGGRFTDMTRVDRVEWWIDGAKRSTDWGFQYDFGQRARAVPVEIRAWDTWGNASVKTITVQLDATAPVVTSLTPAEGAYVRTDTVTSVLTATDPSGVSAYLGIAGYNAEQIGPGTWTVTVPSGRRDGRLYFPWQVSDAAGNSTAVTRSVIVDRVRPTITNVDAPGNNAKVSGTVRTTVTATDTNGIGKVEVRVNGTAVNVDTVAPWVLNVYPNRYGATFTVAWFVYDKAGNAVSTSTRTWRRS